MLQEGVPQLRAEIDAKFEAHTGQILTFGSGDCGHVAVEKDPMIKFLWVVYNFRLSAKRTKGPVGRYHLGRKGVLTGLQ